MALSGLPRENPDPLSFPGSHHMRLYPVTLVVSRKTWPMIGIRPTKGIIGDYRQPAEAKPESLAGNPSKDSR